MLHALAYIQRCSARILNPIPIRMNPPSISMRLPSFAPAFLPKRMPSMDTIKVMLPIINTGSKIASQRGVSCVAIKAKVMPTISASMLVANDMVNNTNGFSGLKPFRCSSGFRLSQIILTPKIARRPKAIQWSY